MRLLKQFGSDQQAPWKLKKEDPERMATVLYVLCEVIRNVALVLQSFMPDSMAKMLGLLKIQDDACLLSYAGVAGALTSGTSLDAPEGIFPRFIDHEELDKSYEGEGYDGAFFIKRALRQNPKSKETVFEIILSNGQAEELLSTDLETAKKKGKLSAVSA